VRLSKVRLGWVDLEWFNLLHSVYIAADSAQSLFFLQMNEEGSRNGYFF
jgi:hypothetical protein